MKKGSIKINRINGEVLKELSSIIRDDVKDPRIDPFVSVTKVDVTPDLQFCRCYVSTFSGGKDLEETIEGLKSAGGFIRRELAHRVDLRKTPEITFIADHNMEYAMEMAKRIEELAKAGGLPREEEQDPEEQDLEEQDREDQDMNEQNLKEEVRTDDPTREPDETDEVDEDD